MIKQLTWLVEKCDMSIVVHESVLLSLSLSLLCQIFYRQRLINLVLKINYWPRINANSNANAYLPHMTAALNMMLMCGVIWFHLFRLDDDRFFFLFTKKSKEKTTDLYCTEHWSRKKTKTYVNRVLRWNETKWVWFGSNDIIKTDEIRNVCAIAEHWVHIYICIYKQLDLLIIACAAAITA